MADELTVSVAQLRRVLDRVLDEIARRNGDVLALTADYYRVLPPDAAYDFEGVPDVQALPVAQLSDDVDELGTMIDVGRTVVPWHDLGHLIGILQRIAAQDRP
ncbi:hypothetical protein [Blastococcus haudaquaticus]|uniref:Uncharacterized protein n=1 Tax=Blastococcus haudaquaticus TaxID=1938745 RepID=A0A286GZA8_9ACTN|nr:hypothetical protein [Blastococcus haudaquaticus]SOE00868.1 hypothetical protein SAMN06272739_2828 [Blastococcus haudaquaticus]